ncbi:hypothetical protein TIFTF001_046650 [Ficus carica]|uniref:Hcy-binding domain-containing protein n=1 Tax=Ficus carica TaxID=3494 RepID=A0AA87ZTN0_FICCA|nr:hypothetical protein TIFTF001_046650 [Ficus carica]
MERGASLMTEFLRHSGGAAVIDGGLATELERHGADLNDPLWSAKCLLTSPHLIRARKAVCFCISLGQQICSELNAKENIKMYMDHYVWMVSDPLSVVVHLDYLEAGADIIITASYQATIQGFETRGFSREESEALLKKSVEVALEARDIYYERCSKSSSSAVGDDKILKRRPILVAASVGSYGAYLADGSEYRIEGIMFFLFCCVPFSSGIYGDAITLKVLKDFHRRRVQVLAESGADLIAFETVPNKIEAQAYVEILDEENISIPAWFSFNSKDGINVVSGDSILEFASIAESCKKVVAVGINCTPPRFIHGLISSLSKVTTKPILIYPNSGESYDPDKKEWVQNTGVSDDDFVSYVNKWIEIGASLVGGCCRTTPDTIRAIYRTLSNNRLLQPCSNLVDLKE